MPGKPAPAPSPSPSGTAPTGRSEQSHDGDLDASFSEMLTVLAERVPPGTAASPAPADAFADIWETFARLRQALDLPEAVPAAPAEDSSAQVSAALMDDAMTEARACAAWYRDTPEWQRISLVADAARALLAAIHDAARDYWSEISRDVRIRGFLRTVTARTSRTIATCAGALAGRLEHDDARPARAWQAMSRLHHAAAAHADHIIGYQPPVQGARQIIAGSRRPPRQPKTPAPAPASSPAALAALSFPASATHSTTAMSPSAPHPSAPRTILRATAAKR